MDNPKTFLLAGHSIFTVTNTTTGKSFTYRITHQEGKPHFVGVLSGPDNTQDYTFIGTIFDQQTFRHSPKGGISKDAQSVKVFDWLWQHLDNLPASVTLKHCGYCARCGKLLTTEESLSSGYGPFCRTQIERIVA